MALLSFPSPQSGAYRTSGEDDEGFGVVSVLSHLDAFRRRLVYSFAAIVIGILLGFAFINRVVDVILAPTRRVLPSGNRLIYTQPGEAFGLYIQIALIVGIVLAMPFIMYQVWRLIVPLVPTGGKKFAIPFVLMSTIGFVAGALFNHHVVFPFLMTFFASFDTPDLVFMPRLGDVFALYVRMLLGLGAVFQMPTVVFFFAKTGLLTAGFLWRNFRYAIFVIFIVAAVITPTGDFAIQTIFAAPMIGLYLLSILIAWMFGRSQSVPPD